MEFYYLDLFLFVGRILSLKSPKIAHLILFLYLAAIRKLKPKVLSIEPISFEKFEELVCDNSFKFNFFGDLYSCVLLSINTLVALSATNKSWLNISKLNSGSKQKKESAKNYESFQWKIAMPPVETQKSTSAKYYIQCLCVSNAPKDFVLYVTDVKLFNIHHHFHNENPVCDLINRVEVKHLLEHKFPSVAKNAVVSGVFAQSDISNKDYEDILDEYFMTPRLLRVGEIISVDVSKCGDHFQSRPSLCCVLFVYFKVITLKGDSAAQEHYVVKGYTDLYLNPTVHSYLPPKNYLHIKTVKQIPGFDVFKCPDGLLSYFNKLRKIFKFLIRDKSIEGMILLSGAKGSGKKTVVKTVAESFGLNFLQVNCFDFFGINPSQVKGKLDQLCLRARISVPCITYLENVELLGREQNYNENSRLIDIFVSHMQQLWMRKSNSYPLLVVGSTHLKPSEIVPAVARLFVHTIPFVVPKLSESYSSLKWLLKSSNMICSSSDVKNVAEKIRGYLFADLVLLMQQTIHIQRKDSSAPVDSSRIINVRHFMEAVEIMEASYSDSIGAAKVPVVHWDDVGGLSDLKEEIMLTLNLPVQHPELFASGLKRSGILFYGPPGTGKTLMAKAVATECNYNFLSVKGPELMNMYVGQSEKNVREVFERAREASPCIIFFDELDSLAPSRGKSGDSGAVTDRVVSQLLAEMDGLDKNKDVFIIAATNRPDLIDQALVRPGRFDKKFYVGVCKDKESIFTVLKALTRRFSLGKDVDFEKVIEALPTQVTGADLYSVCSNAWFAAARKAVRIIENGSEVSLPLKVVLDDFLEAVSQFVPSLTSEDMNYYENLKSSQSGATW